MPASQFANSIILNVDDNEGARYAKSRILLRAGFNVIEAVNGNAALARAREDLPDLVLLDVKLPDVNGMEVCRQLKSDPATSAILVLQISASYVGMADKVRGIQGGADNYLFEPVEPEELVANVTALLRLGRVERELREVARRKDEFLATLAHELRNPLGPIRSAVELLCKLDPDVPPVQYNARQTILRHTGHLVRLVDDLLDVARISHGKITLHIEPVELKAFIHSACESVAYQAQTRQQRLDVVLPPEPVWIEGDGVRLAQIVGNLLHNAVKFTPPGGQVKLEVVREGPEAVIRVSDTGIGIEPEKLEFVFGLFAQHGFSSDRVQDGLGIGLSLVRTLVGLHHGSVSASSPGLGQGSVFEVRLPVLADSPAAQVAALAVEQATAARILVVDDNADAADMLAELLRIVDHEVVVAYSGSQALALANEFQPDVVFLDIGLPDMSGYQAAAAMRQITGVETAQLIALTGYGQPRDRARALEAGFDEHVVKPIDFEKVLALKLRPRVR